MTDLLLVLAVVAFLAIGTLAPFVLSLGYVWVDMFLPHLISDALLRDVPVALIMAIAAIGSYLVLDRNAPPRPSLLLLLYFILAAWITLTTSWAVAPVQAWLKWDPSIKTLLFAAFLPFVFRTRVHIEAFCLTILFASAAHILPWGLKVMISGGGYGLSLGQLSSNQSFLSESSAIAAICFSFLPFVFLFARENVLLPKSRFVPIGFYAMAAIYGLGAMGTFARVAIVGSVTLFAGLWVQAKRKIWFTAIAGLAIVAVLSLSANSQWTDRISTTQDYTTENSAATRIAVWRWTWNFAQENPFGGGFNSFYVNRIEVPSGDPLNPQIQFARAFHNIYFAVFGEHGYLGLLIYGAILALSLHSLGRTRKLLKDHPEHGWASNMASAARLSLIVFLTCANFIDVSFNPVLWDLLGLTLCLQEYRRRALATSGTVMRQTETQPRRPMPVPMPVPVAARLSPSSALARPPTLSRPA